MSKTKAKAAALPPSRIKKMMQSDEEVGKIAAASPIAVSKACEGFMRDLVEAAAEEAAQRGSKKVTMYHFKRAILSNAQYDFLNDMVKDVPDPVAAADKPKKPRAPRAKKEGGEAKPKAKGKKKGKSKDEDETDEDEAAVAAGMPEETPADEQMDAANDSENYDE